MSRELQLAWAAGFIDGEGCIHIAKQHYKKYENYQLVLRVTQRTPEPLVVLQDTFGGIGLRKTYNSSSFNKKPQWVWQVGNAAAGLVIQEICPYLVVKKEQAELALRFQSLRSESTFRDERTGRFRTFDKSEYRRLYEQMRALKVVKECQAQDRPQQQTFQENTM